MAAAIVATAVVAYLAGSRGALQELDSKPRAAPVEGRNETASLPAATRAAMKPPEAPTGRSRPQASTANAPRTTEPLPRSDTPIVKVYGVLAARARAGDADASCRLAQDLERCRDYAFQQYALGETGDVDVELVADSRKRGASEQQVAQQVDTFAHLREYMASLEPMCAGLPMSRTREVYDWMLLAAEQGNAAAAGRFVTRMPDQSQIFERPDQIETYRERAPEFARRALEGGDPDVVQVLADAYSTPVGAEWRSPFAQLVTRDPVEAYALFRLHALLTGATDSPDHQRMLRLARELTPRQLAAAEARAAALRAGPYANVPLETSEREIARSRHFCAD